MPQRRILRDISCSRRFDDVLSPSEIQIINIDKGQLAVGFCAINLLGRAKAAINDLDRIERLIKLDAFVNSHSDFTEHPTVVNGASDFLIEALGEDKGNHVRFAVGTNSLPSEAAVEIEALFRIAK